MLHYINGVSLFDSDADALVNPVNCHGVMGKGIAKEFSKRFPEILSPYKEACAKHILRPGMIMKIKMCIKPELFMINHPTIILFATKDHWRNPSKLEWIREGATELLNRASEWNLKSIAMPLIGCGLGGLNWSDVQPILEELFGSTNLDIMIHFPI